MSAASSSRQPYMQVTIRRNKDVTALVNQLRDILHMVYRVQWTDTKRKHANKLVNAQKALNLEETVELMLELGPEACTNTITIVGISAMRRPTNHEPVELAEIRRAILDEMLKRHDANQEQPPNPTIPDPSRQLLPPDLGAVNKPTRKRMSANNNGSEVDEPENPRKRITTDSDVSFRLSDAYIARLLEDGPSQLNQTLLNDLLEETTAANLSQAVPPAQNESSNDTIVELTASLARNIDDVARDRIRGQIQAILKDEDDQDEHLRE
ncbi:hypothetical protein CcaCcLH18_13398 [Colletotrichum camelliae]|nr:hypothetical protein CcaCcLH18_13398 [Colletotrichum camelliae]